MSRPQDGVPARVRYRWGRLRNHLHKLRWGVRTVGARRSARGLLRLGHLLVRRPEVAEVPLGAGGVLRFAVPDEMSPALVVFGQLIDPEYAFLRRAHLDGAVHWDVGAALGQYTVFAGTLGRTTVLACEPNPRLAARLRENVRLNRLDDVVDVRQCAATRSTGPVVFAAEASPFVGSVLDRADDAEQPGGGPGGEVVDGVALDDLAARTGTTRVDVLKVNVAGAEGEVLHGARRLLRDHAVGVLVLLVGERALEAYRMVQGLGYRFFFYDTDAAHLVEVTRLDAGTLRHPPSPARHVIAIAPELVDGGSALTVPLAPTGRA